MGAPRLNNIWQSLLSTPLRRIPKLFPCWKIIWLTMFGFAHGAPGPIPPTFTDDPRSIAFSVVPIPIVAPCRFVIL